MQKNILIVILTFIISFQLYSQDIQQDAILQFSNSWVFTLEGGVTTGYTDYESANLKGTLRGAVEYYPSRSSSNIFGLKIYGGVQQVGGKDSRSSITTKDGPRDPLPPLFQTDMILLGGALSYSYSIEEEYFPFVQLGLSNIWFSPKDPNGIKLEGNAVNLYNNTSLVFDVGLGLKYLLNDIISLNISGGIHFSSTDYIDDVAAGSNNDIYYSGMIGISVAPFGPGDSDGDGIVDEFDACPDQTEDFDGFEDDDGCPDYDNDFDGIPDIEDTCPLGAEDYDGFVDSDGCPDPDNDLDGILDINDDCPDEAEDKDGFLDDDGCPDIDNDGDGILDIDDECPNKPETFNGFEDQDGCPDQINVLSIEKITLTAKDIFYSNTATIKPEGISKLNEALEVILHEPNSKWRIEGHMDSQGSEQFIRQISYDRAAAVLEFFTSYGISSDRFSIYGMSDDFPIANNTNEEGREKNRRIEIIKEKEF
jgi:outer membrane protein OmpA-like peptidoglycan-associated protein